MLLMDITSCAAALYDGGWRAEDKTYLIEEYGFTDAEVTTVCEWLETYDRI